MQGGHTLVGRNGAIGKIPDAQFGSLESRETERAMFHGKAQQSTFVRLKPSPIAAGLSGKSELATRRQKSAPVETGALGAI
jgi:hypothetical protein